MVKEKKKVHMIIRHGVLQEHSAPTVHHDERDDMDTQQAVSSASGLAISIVLPMIAGIGIGKYLDTTFHTEGRYTVALLFLGCVVGIGQLFILQRKK